jgi:hypothetical protein
MTKKTIAKHFYKKDKTTMAESKENLKIVTSEFRASHPHVLKPSEVVKGDGKLQYSIEMLFDKKTTKLSDLQAPIKEAITGKWGKDKAKWPSPLKTPIRDGDKPHGKKKEVKPEHEGMWVVRASTSAEYSKPYVVGRDPNVELTSESEFYPGCYARAALKAHAYEFADKEGVKFILDGVQFIRDGKPLGGRRPANQVFGTVEGDSGLDDFAPGGEEVGTSDEQETFL